MTEEVKELGERVDASVEVPGAERAVKVESGRVDSEGGERVSIPAPESDTAWMEEDHPNEASAEDVEQAKRYQEAERREMESRKAQMKALQHEDGVYQIAAILFATAGATRKIDQSLIATCFGKAEEFVSHAKGRVLAVKAKHPIAENKEKFPESIGRVSGSVLDLMRDIVNAEDDEDGGDEE